MDLEKCSFERRESIIEASRELFLGSEVSGYDGQSFVLNPRAHDFTNNVLDYLLISASENGGKIRVDTPTYLPEANRLSGYLLGKGLGDFGIQRNF